MKRKVAKRSESDIATEEESCYSEPACKKYTRRSYQSFNFQNTCFFCDGDDIEDILHKVTSLALHKRVYDIAVETQDPKLGEGDMIAIEAVYHTRCLVGYYNKRRTPKETNNLLYCNLPY